MRLTGETYPSAGLAGFCHMWWNPGHPGALLTDPVHRVRGIAYTSRPDAPEEQFQARALSLYAECG